MTTAELLCAAEPSASDGPPAASKSFLAIDQLPAHQAVREGNRQLREGQPAAALEAYAYAKELRPEAPQIPFVEGLARYDLHQYDAARDAFRKAAVAKDEKLANDALYSIGAAYHAEALASLDDPQQAIEKLESAMQRYREVLANQPDHTAARDANFKAATMHRQIRQMLEQQEQEQSESCDNPSEEEGDQQEQQQQSQPQDEQQEEQQEQSSDAQQQQQEQDEQQQEAQQAEGSEDQEEASAQPEPSEEEQEQAEQIPQSQESAEEQEERVSREQAERQLREMMQAMREREKQRRRQVRKMPIAPVEKDW